MRDGSVPAATRAATDATSNEVLPVPGPPRTSSGPRSCAMTSAATLSQPDGAGASGEVRAKAAGYDPQECCDFRLAVAEYEKAILAAALDRCRWNQRAAAAALSLSYDQLRHAMKRHQLQGT